MRGLTYGQPLTRGNAPAGRGFGDMLRGQAGGFGSGAEARVAVYGESEPAPVEPVEKKRRSGAATHGRNIKAANQSHRWPAMVIGRKINMVEAGKPWREFETKLDNRLQRRGRPVPLKSWMLVYYDPDHMRDMMTERYPKKLQRVSEGRDSELRGFSQGVMREINQAIGSLASEKLVADQSLFDESPELWQRVLDPDNVELEYHDKNTCETAQAQVNNMWLASRFACGRQEGYGPYGFGIQLPDEGGLLAAEAAAIDDIMQDFGFDTVEARRNRQFTIKVAETTPLPATNLSLTFPEYPLAIPLQQPHAYVVS